MFNISVQYQKQIRNMEKCCGAEGGGIQLYCSPLPILIQVFLLCRVVSFCGLGGGSGFAEDSATIPNPSWAQCSSRAPLSLPSSTPSPPSPTLGILNSSGGNTSGTPLSSQCWTQRWCYAHTTRAAVTYNTQRQQYEHIASAGLNRIEP